MVLGLLDRLQIFWQLCLIELIGLLMGLGLLALLHLICSRLLAEFGMLVFFTSLKACVHYFLSNVCFSSNDSLSKSMKNNFYFIWKALFILEIFNFLYFCFPLFLRMWVSFRGWSKKIFKFMTSQELNDKFCLISWEGNKCDIETLSIDRLLIKKHFYGKIMQKICTKS